MTIVVPDLHLEFEKYNTNLVEPAQTLFNQLCGDSEFTWAFLNMLSYMEHIGSYKIMSTQRGDGMDYQTLKHLNEETGHAVLFKRHAERSTQRRLDYSAKAMLAPASARMYFSKLEAIIIRIFGDSGNSRVVYLYMSLIIEFRAVWAYKILQKAIEANQLDIKLSKLLAEEEGHLVSMVRRLSDDGFYSVETIQKLWKDEKMLFGRLLNSVAVLYESKYPKVA